MTTQLGHISGINVYVDDYDQAIRFYQDVLGFELINNMEMDEGMRWVTLKPSTDSQTQIILCKATTQSQHALIGKQAGDGVFMILTTDDFAKSYQVFKDNGVVFIQAPRLEPYGKVVIFEDLYGNKWDLIEPIIG